MADSDREMHAALHQVLQEVLPEREESRQYQTIFDQFISEMVPRIREADPLFVDHQLVGSARQRLRIRQRDEFDVNILMDSDLVWGPDTSQTGPCSAFVTMKAKPVTAPTPVPQGPSAAGSLQRILDPAGKYVVPWLAVDRLYSAADKAVNQIMSQSGLRMQIEPLRRHLPAVTARVSSGRLTISVDLVPAFRFSLVLPPSPAPVVDFGRRVNQSVFKVGEKVPFSIAPKPPKEDNRTYWWRVDFYDLGDRVFRDRVNMKNTIRLVKCLRNCQSHSSDGEDGGWYHLSSYMIKTACYWQDAGEDDPQRFWQQGLDVVVVAVLRRLARYLADGCFLDFWSPDFNLLRRADVDPMYWTQLSNRLTRICNALSGPNKVEEVQRFFLD